MEYSSSINLYIGDADSKRYGYDKLSNNGLLYQKIIDFCWYRYCKHQAARKNERSGAELTVDFISDRSQETQEVVHFTYSASVMESHTIKNTKHNLNTRNLSGLYLR